MPDRATSARPAGLRHADWQGRLARPRRTPARADGAPSSACLGAASSAVSVDSTRPIARNSKVGTFIRGRNVAASGFSRKAVAVVNLWNASRSLPAKAGSHELVRLAGSHAEIPNPEPRAPTLLHISRYTRRRRERERARSSLVAAARARARPDRVAAVGHAQRDARARRERRRCRCCRLPH